MRPLCIFASPSVVDHSQIDLVVNPSTALPSITSVPQLAFNITAAPTGVNGATNPFAATNSSNLVNSASVARACTASSENVTDQANTRLVWNMLNINTTYTVSQSGNINACADQANNFLFTWYKLVGGVTPSSGYDLDNTRPVPITNSQGNSATLTISPVSAIDLIVCVIERSPSLAPSCTTSITKSNSNRLYSYRASVAGSGQMPGNSGPSSDGIGRQSKKAAWNIYPNPSTGVISITSTKVGTSASIPNQKLYIYNTTGNRLAMVKTINGIGKTNLSGLHNGVYYLKSDSGSVTVFSILK